MDCLSKWADHAGQLSTEDERTGILDGTDDRGNTALHYLMEHNDSKMVEMVEKLIGLGAGVSNKRDSLSGS